MRGHPGLWLGPSLAQTSSVTRHLFSLPHLSSVCHLLCLFRLLITLGAPGAPCFAPCLLCVALHVLPCVYSQSQLRVGWLCGLHLPAHAMGSSHQYYVGTLVCLLLIPIVQGIFDPLLCSGRIAGRDKKLTVWWSQVLMNHFIVHIRSIQGPN